jgi:hypothetical protein
VRLQARHSPRAALLVAALGLVPGCGPASETASLSFPIDERGAIFMVHADTSADGADIELDWAASFDNRRSQACAVAVYRWTDTMVDLELVGPTASDPQAWPQTFAGGELVETGVVEADGTLTLGPSLVHDPAPLVYGQFLLATCPDAQLTVGVRSEAVVDLGIRSLTETFVLRLLLLR